MFTTTNRQQVLNHPFTEPTHYKKYLYFSVKGCQSSSTYLQLENTRKKPKIRTSTVHQFFLPSPPTSKPYHCTSAGLMSASPKRIWPSISVGIHLLTFNNQSCTQRSCHCLRCPGFFLIQATQNHHSSPRQIPLNWGYFAKSRMALWMAEHICLHQVRNAPGVVMKKMHSSADYLHTFQGHHSSVFWSTCLHPYYQRASHQHHPHQPLAHSLLREAPNCQTTCYTLTPSYAISSHGMRISP